MTVRKATAGDLAAILKIYDAARTYMAEHGNPHQWEDGYPDEAVVRGDIAGGNAYVVERGGDVLGVFVFLLGEEPTYRVIEQGQWHSAGAYGTIHRIASAGKIKGFAAICFDYCAEKTGCLRIDTHRDNRAMLGAIERYGFQKCGIIHVRNGDRIAFDLLTRQA